MSTDPGDASHRRPAAWARWSDPGLPIRLASTRVGRDALASDALSSCVEWVEIGAGDPAEVDGVVFPNLVGGEATEALAVWCADLAVLDECARYSRPGRAAFLETVFARNRLRARARVVRPLVEFHDAHDLLLRVRGEEGAAELAQLARSPSLYERAFRHHLARPAEPQNVLRILRLILAELRPRLAPRDRRALRLAVDDFGRGSLPLLAPRTLLRHHSERGGGGRVASQLFLDPYPAELEAPRLERDGELA